MKVSAIFLIVVFGTASSAWGQGGHQGWQADWEKTVEAAKREGKVVAAIPPSADVRKALEEAFTKRFGITIESDPARGGSSAGTLRM